MKPLPFKGFDLKAYDHYSAEEIHVMTTGARLLLLALSLPRKRVVKAAMAASHLCRDICHPKPRRGR